MVSAEPIRVCKQHKTPLVEGKDDTLVCAAKRGPGGHQAHVCLSWDVVQPKGGQVVTVDHRGDVRPAERPPGAKRVAIWKGSDGAATLYLRIFSGRRKTGDAYQLRWEVVAAGKSQQGTWATAQDEQAARAAYAAEVAKAKQAGWKEQTIGLGSGKRYEFKPVPAPRRAA